MGGTLTTNDAALKSASLLLVALGLLVMWVPYAAMAPTAATTMTTTPLCDRAGCNCVKTAQYWIIANCTFENQKNVEIEAGSLPPELIELEINDCNELHLLDGAFSRLQLLQRVRLRNVRQLRVRRNAFNNLSAKGTLLEILDCGVVVMETHAFKGVQGPLTALISRCSHVIIQSTAFSWLLAITVKDVPRLELAEKSFSFEKPKTSTYHGNGPATRVLLQNVVMPVLPSLAFPSSAAELRLVDVEVRTVRRDAFNALQLSSVIVHNSSLHKIETGAFSERTFIEKLEMSNVRIRALGANAILGAIQHLTIQHSRINEIVGGAINITVASVTIRSNVFDKIRSRGFMLKSWNRLNVDANLFQWSEADAFSTDFEHLQGAGNVFTFTGNEIQDFGPGAFSFAVDALQLGAHRLDAQVGDNRFAQRCRCDLPNWIQEVVTGEKGSQESVDWLFNTSFCTVDSVLAKCFSLEEGYMSMRNFEAVVCGTDKLIVCEEASQGKIAISVVQNEDGAVDDDDGSEYESELDREKKVLSVIFLAVVSGIAVMLTVTLLMWLKRNGYCVQARILYMPSTTSCLTVFHRVFASVRGGGGVVAAGSISRLNVREYNEIHQPRQQRAAMLATDAASDLDVEAEYVPVEDKWTQTLPEELTQELLQSLREKLDDPENYSEARDMIEHLYDLIKVEQSCSNNNTPSTSDTIEVYDDDGGGDAEENLYDVIQLPISTPAARRAKLCNGKTKRAVCHVGTKAPSLDELLPAATYAQIQRARQPPPLITDYAQPRDTANPRDHLYTELPGGPHHVPPAEGRPPPVPLSPIPSRLHTAQGKAPSRPLSFLRTLGENLLPRNALGMDKAEAADKAGHDYAELPTVTKCSANMANRPLPNKPDQGDDPGTAT